MNVPEHETNAAHRVKAFLGAMAAHDWEGVARAVSAGIERTGPYRDRFTGRAAYVAFLREVMEPLAGYEMHVDRVMVGEDPRVVVVELREVVVMHGQRIETPEALILELDGDGLIARIAVYTQNEPERPITA